MAKTRHFLLQAFVRKFLIVFLPFLLIVSLVFLIQISILSARINLESGELLRFFSYLIPEILLYTIPFALIAALANLFTSLSEENELIALFALGHRPIDLLKQYLPATILLSALLAVLSLMLYPQMKQKIQIFKERKLAEATLKISPNKLSQSFGDYHVYVAARDEKGYRDIVLFDNHDRTRQRLFLAKRATAQNDGKRLALTLYDGTGESEERGKIESLRYRKLTVYQYPRFSERSYLNFRRFWERAATDRHQRGKLLYFIFISISPLFILPLSAALGIFNPRYERNRAAAVIFFNALLIYVPAVLIQKSGSLALFALLFAAEVLIVTLLLQRKVLKRF